MTLCAWTGAGCTVQLTVSSSLLLITLSVCGLNAPPVPLPATFATGGDMVTFRTVIGPSGVALYVTDSVGFSANSILLESPPLGGLPGTLSLASLGGSAQMNVTQLFVEASANVAYLNAQPPAPFAPPVAPNPPPPPPPFPNAPPSQDLYSIAVSAGLHRWLPFAGSPTVDPLSDVPALRDAEPNSPILLLYTPSGSGNPLAGGAISAYSSLGTTTPITMTSPFTVGFAVAQGSGGIPLVNNPVSSDVNEANTGGGSWVLGLGSRVEERPTSGHRP